MRFGLYLMHLARKRLAELSTATGEARDAAVQWCKWSRHMLVWQLEARRDAAVWQVHAWLHEAVWQLYAWRHEAGWQVHVWRDTARWQVHVWRDMARWQVHAWRDMAIWHVQTWRDATVRRIEAWRVALVRRVQSWMRLTIATIYATIDAIGRCIQTTVRCMRECCNSTRRCANEFTTAFFTCFRSCGDALAQCSQAKYDDWRTNMRVYWPLSSQRRLIKFWTELQYQLGRLWALCLIALFTLVLISEFSLLSQFSATVSWFPEPPPYDNDTLNGLPSPTPIGFVLARGGRPQDTAEEWLFALGVVMILCCAWSLRHLELSIVWYAS